MTILRFPACCYRDRGQRLEKFATRGTTKILRLSGYLPLAKEKKNEKSNLLSPLPQGAPNPLKRQNAVFTDSIRHQSLSFTLNFAYSAPSFLFSFSLPFSYFYACRHIQRVHDFIAFFKNFPLFFLFFQKDRWPRNFPPENTRVAAQG